jgi:hypothetical protein
LRIKEKETYLILQEHDDDNDDDDSTYKPKGRRNIGGRERDGGTNFILRIKEKETYLIFQEHDDDDDDITFVPLAQPLP